jgi:hypothetical protein
MKKTSIGQIVKIANTFSKLAQVQINYNPAPDVMNAALEIVEKWSQAKSFRGLVPVQRQDVQGNFLQGLQSVNVNPSKTDAAGFVEGGQDKDVDTINLNLQGIINTTGGKNKYAARAIASVLAHERAHSVSWDPNSNQFIGGESTAERVEDDISKWMEANPQILDSIQSYKNLPE